MFKKSPAMVTIAALGLLTLIAGCTTMQGAGGIQANIFSKLNDINPFATTDQEFNRLVNTGKYDEAEQFYKLHYVDYFSKHYGVSLKPATPEMVALSEHVFARDYKKLVGSTIDALSAIHTTTVPDKWDAQYQAYAQGIELLGKWRSTTLFTLTQTGANAIQKLNGEVDRVQTLAAGDKDAALVATFNEVVLTGNTNRKYLSGTLSEADYKFSDAFQKVAINAIENTKTEVARAALVKRLLPVLSAESSRTAVDLHIVKVAKDRMLADGRVDLSELAELTDLVKTYGASFDEIKGLVKVGYVDLTAASFRERNMFDFQISFNQEYAFDLINAEDALLGKSSLSTFDYIFVTDLSAAKIYRDFKNKRELSSRMQTGVQQKQNPAYVRAMTNYQSALTSMQSTKMQNAVEGSQPCYGGVFACALLAAARGMAEGASENNVNAASEALAKTSQTIDQPVFSPYNYQLVDIEESKVARVDYYVIDVKKGKILSNFFAVKDQEKFIVSYNVQEQDPNRASILRNNQSEDDVTEWEKKPIVVRVADLFDPQHLKGREVKPFSNAEAFLKTISSRKYASAAPVYSKGVEPKASRGESQTIADERFESVVIIKNSKGLGAGFYVTPDLVLTAYHVVDGSNLVEMTFYDGTKTFGKVVDQDVRLDLALVKAQTVGKPVKIHSGPIRLGETVEAIGHPKGYEFTITRGVVSAVRKQKGAVVGANSLVEFVQTDTPISPGNSGGPLFLKDSVIGVNDWVRVDKASQNLNFSVSYNEIRAYLDRIQGQNQ